MKARVKGTDEPFRDIETVEIKGVCGIYFAKDVEFEPTPDHWQDLRERAAIAAMQGVLSEPLIEGVNPNPSVEEVTDLAVKLADALVKILKGE